MQYFGVPRCPYCKKRVNLIRTWSLKRQGEYQCPRCGGISNIFLSPLVYVFALLAVFSGGAIYFFHRFVLDDVGLTTCFQVLLPFVVFFLLSLFLVYLAKPVIKRVPREEGKKRGGRQEQRRTHSQETGPMFTDTGDYLPREDHRVGPFQQEPYQGTSPRQALQDQPTTVLDTTGSVSQQELKGPQMRPARPLSQDGEITSGRPLSPAQRPSQTSQRPVGAQTTAGQPVRRAPAGQETARQPRVSQPAPQVSRSAPAGQETARQPRVSQPAPQASRSAPAGQETARQPRVSQPAPQASRSAPAGQETARQPRVSQPAPQVSRSAPAGQETARQPQVSQPGPRRTRTVHSVEIPDITQDFFAKYNDPEYVNRRLKELKEEREKEQS